MRVLAPGDIAPGDTLRLAARPRARWTLRRCSELLYGSGNAGEEHARIHSPIARARTRARARCLGGGWCAECGS